jgi:hypothetical protein
LDLYSSSTTSLFASPGRRSATWITIHFSINPLPREVAQEARITEIACDQPMSLAEGSLDEMDVLTRKLSEFTTMQVVHGFAVSPPTSLVGVPTYRRSIIQEEQMSMDGTASLPSSSAAEIRELTADDLMTEGNTTGEPVLEDERMSRVWSNSLHCDDRSNMSCGD